MFPLLSRFQVSFRTDVQKRLTPPAPAPLITEEDLVHLPGAVRNYLRFVGAVGKPRVWNFRAAGTGTLKRSPDRSWMNIATLQYNFFHDPARFYYLKSSLLGIPFEGLHVYAGEHATMKVNAGYFLPVVDAGGARMDMSETVTLFNDMCLLSPSTLIDKSIFWEQVDPLTVWARFTHNGITISATLYFGENGELTRFVSDDRYMSADGKTYLRYQWSTPLKSYRDLDGRKVPVYGEASWKMPEGDFTYARFTIEEIEYNCSGFR